MSDSSTAEIGTAAGAPGLSAQNRARRRLAAILIGAGLLACGAAAALVGLAAGVMGTDGCSVTPPGWVSIWLVGVWPLAVLVAALLPPILIARGASYSRAGLAFVTAGLIAIGIWLLWIPIVDLYC